VKVPNVPLANIAFSWWFRWWFRWWFCSSSRFFLFCGAWHGWYRCGERCSGSGFIHCGCGGCQPSCGCDGCLP
jgi:hypothetical protein